MLFFAYSCPASEKEHDLLYLFLFQLQRKAWSSCYSYSKKHGLLCFFAYFCSNFSKKAWSSLLILVPASAKNIVFFACSFTTAVKHVILGLFLFQLQQKAWPSLLILIPATAKSMVFFAYSCSRYFNKAWSSFLILFQLHQNAWFLFQLQQKCLVFFAYSCSKGLQ
jgi:hypothetical protein